MIYNGIWLYIGMVVGTVLAIINIVECKRDKSKISEYIKWCLAYFIVIGICGIGGTSFFIMMVVDRTTMNDNSGHYESQWENNISAIDDSIGIHGSRYCINSGTDVKYIQSTNGYKEIKTIDASFCKIQEDGLNKVVYKKQVRNEGILDTILGDGMYGKHYFEIHIPKDSMSTDFNIDLKN